MRTPYVTGQRDVFTSTKNISLQWPSGPLYPRNGHSQPSGGGRLALVSDPLSWGSKNPDPNADKTNFEAWWRQPARESWRLAMG